MMSEQLAISVADLTRILLEDTLHNMFLPPAMPPVPWQNALSCSCRHTTSPRQNCRLCCRPGISAPLFFGSPEN
ncbi:hypothetical protein CF58_30970 [Escherichia coli]|nr:hypothetical protein CF58_30970 [Escherichia coli]